VKLTPGTYYLAVDSDSVYQGAYSLTLTCTSDKERIFLPLLEQK
jgi:hypothetical protein